LLGFEVEDGREDWWWRTEAEKGRPSMEEAEAPAAAAELIAVLLHGEDDPE